MRRQLLPAVKAFALLTLLLGLAYPLAMTGAAQVLFGDRADGSPVRDASGTVVGSELLGQQFTGAQWFHPRPSAAGDGYDATASGASNLGPTDDELLRTVRQRAIAYRADNGLPPGTEVPVDAVTASASGLDPHISLANARLQAPRVARERGLPVASVLAAVDDSVDDRVLGVFGEPGVNVLRLNLLLEQRGS